MKILNCLFVPAALMFSAVTTSCVASGTSNAKNSTLTSRTFELPAFNAISNETIVDIDVRVGDSQNVSLEAPTSHIDRFTLSVKDGKLVIASKGNIRMEGGSKSYKMTIQMKELRSVDVNGSGDIDIRESISVPELSLSVNGSGDISAENISVDKIMVKVNGSGDVDIAGTTSTAGLTVSGSGDIDASLSGIKYINAAIYGSGDITLSGNSAKGTFVSNGSGDFNATKMIIQDLSATSNGSGDIDCYCKGTFSGSANGSGDITVLGQKQKGKISRNVILK